MYYRIIIIFLFFSSTISAELLKPTVGGEEKEILKIAGKRRVYTILDDGETIYQIQGPARIKLIARYPSPKKTRKSQAFSYSVQIDDQEPMRIQHRYKVCLLYTSPSPRD